MNRPIKIYNQKNKDKYALDLMNNTTNSQNNNTNTFHNNPISVLNNHFMLNTTVHSDIADSTNGIDSWPYLTGLNEHANGNNNNKGNNTDTLLTSRYGVYHTNIIWASKCSIS
eukprot:UN08436